VNTIVNHQGCDNDRPHFKMEPAEMVKGFADRGRTSFKGSNDLSKGGEKGLPLPALRSLALKLT
jgi:hypothetical protein